MKFYYRAKKGPQDHHEGEIEAVNERMAVAKILGMGMTPVEVKLVRQNSRKAKKIGDKKSVGRIRFFAAKFFQVDIVLFFRYLSDFLNADIPVLQSLQLTRKRFPDGRMSECLGDIEDALKEGEALSDSFRRCPEVFSSLHVNMVRAGEVSGSLSSTVDRLADFLEKDHENRLKVLSSLAYPAIIVCVGAATVFVLLTWVIPKIMEVFQEMDQALPLITRVLMGVSSFFVHFWWLMIAVIILSIFIFIRWYQTEEGRESVDRRLYALPGLGAFLREVSVARFTRTLGALLQGGVDLVPALGYAGAVVRNCYAQKQLGRMGESVVQGISLSKAFEPGDLLSESDISMISVGEETGQISASLLKLAAFYEKNTDRKIKLMTTMIEPALILGLGMVIGFVVLAMLMPIFEMNLALR